MSEHPQVLQKLEQLVKDRRVSYAQVAVAAGYGEGAVRGWVRDKRLPKNPRIVEILEKFVAMHEARS